MFQSMMDIMPHNLKAEKSFLAAVLKDNNVWFQNEVTPAWFFDKRNKLIANAMQAIAKNGEHIDAEGVIQKLGAKLDQAGGVVYVSEIQSEVVNKKNAESWLKHIRDNSVARQLIVAGDSIKSISIEDNDVDSKIAQAFKLLQSIRTGNNNTLNEISEGLDDRSKRYEDRMRNPGFLSGIKLHIAELNQILKGGIRNGEYFVLGADSSAGKTALAIDCSLHAAMKNKVVLFFSAEMTKETVEDRLIANLSGVDVNVIQTGYGMGNSWIKIDEANKKLDKLTKSHLVIDFTESISPAYCSATIEKVKAIYGRVDLVVIDYLQWMDSDDKNCKTNHEKVYRNTKDVKSLAKSKNIPMLVLSQVNSDASKTGELHPSMMAEAPMQIWRDSDVLATMQTISISKTGPRLIHFKVHKGRSSGIGDTYLVFNPTTMSFRAATKMDIAVMGTMGGVSKNKNIEDIIDEVEDERSPFGA